jgi:hydroxyacylglutathione hydrolase
MYFRQIIHPDLGCASYLIADHCGAAVIDPKWEIDEYLEAAAEAGAVIRHVLETRNHADHVSGRRRLAAATGARLHAPGGLRDGFVVPVGELELVALATPGHRPEHVSFLVHEEGIPRLLLSGDSLLVGDVARPDLAVPAEGAARSPRSRLNRFLRPDDEIEVWPAHVGGSPCASPSSVERVVELNLRGAADPGPVGELDPNALAEVVDRVCLLDVRDPESFDAGYLDGSINLPASGRGLGPRAGWATGAEPIVLVSPSLDAGRATIEVLRAAGVWNLFGLSVADPDGWEEAGLAVRTGGVEQLARRAAPMVGGA